MENDQILTIQGQPRAFRGAVSMRYKTELGPGHVLMGWMVRHCAWVVNNFQVKGTGRTLYRFIRGKDYTGEVVLYGEICFGWNHSEDGAKLNMRWMRGVFFGKLDRTDEFLLLTPMAILESRQHDRKAPANLMPAGLCTAQTFTERRRGANGRRSSLCQGAAVLWPRGALLSCGNSAIAAGP